MTRVVARPLALAALLVSPLAHADRAILVGGTVIEGKAVRKGDRVVIQTEAGEVALPADSVRRIEKSESTVDRFESLYAALPKGDARARLALADYCRDHGMRGEERRVLLEVLDIDRENPQARARLGYEKTEAGWVTRAEAMRGKGMVEHEGRWVTPGDAAQAEHERLEREAAVARRDSEDAELQARRFQLSAQQAALEAEQGRLRDAPYPTMYTPYYYGAFYPNRVVRPFGCVNGFCGATTFRPVRPPAPVLQRHFDDTSMSVVKVPYRRH